MTTALTLLLSIFVQDPPGAAETVLRSIPTLTASAFCV